MTMSNTNKITTQNKFNPNSCKKNLSSLKPIIAVGPNPAWQKTLFFEKFIFGEVNRADAINSYPSGKGINLCRALKIRQYHPGKLLQFAGGDTGEQLCRLLDLEGILHETVKVSEPTRICTTCLCRNSSKMTEIIEPSHTPEPAAIDRFQKLLLKHLSHCAGVAFCGTLPGNTDIFFYQQAAERIVEAGLPLLIDSWRNIVPVLQIDGHILLKVNAEEIKRIAEIDNTRQAISLVLDKYPLEAIAVTDGPGQAYFADRNIFVSYDLPILPKIINPLGSGDTVGAVFFSEYLAGTEPQEAFALGLAAASANCLTPIGGDFDPEAATTIRTNIVIKTIEK